MLRAIICLLMAAVVLSAQPKGPEFNYDESKVGAYKLPDLLAMSNGDRVKDAKTWSEKRRPEILRLFETHVYGRVQGRLKSTTFETTEVERKALGGKAVRKQATVYFAGKKDGPKMDILIYLPAGAKAPAPMFLGLNFRGNHAVHKDPGIKLPMVWRGKGKEYTAVQATEDSRGSSEGQWQVEKILARGYGLATVYYGDIDPDFDDGFQNGIHPLFYKTGQTQPAPDEWGSIGAWAWGLSRALDYLETDKEIDAKRVAVMGHSRLGKTALWAAAQDQRFAMAISNESGEGGAALARRWYGETVKRINTSFPHWFCDNFNKFNDDVNALPVDFHMLIALSAPRPLYVASAQEDQWSDPRGEFLGAKNAEPVYKLFGREGLPADDMPPLDRAVMGTLGYHNRAGKHDVTEFDWEQYLTFADKHLRAKR